MNKESSLRACAGSLSVHWSEREYAKKMDLHNMRCDHHGPVSYTHLDVYKRQVVQHVMDVFLESKAPSLQN